MKKNICSCCGKIYENLFIEYCEQCGIKLTKYQEKSEIIKKWIMAIIGIIIVLNIYFYFFGFTEIWLKGVLENEYIPVFNEEWYIEKGEIDYQDCYISGWISKENLFERRGHVKVCVESDLLGEIETCFVGRFRFTGFGWELIETEKDAFFYEIWDEENREFPLGTERYSIQEEKRWLFEHWTYFPLRSCRPYDTEWELYLDNSIIGEIEGIETYNKCSWIKYRLRAYHYEPYKGFKEYELFYTVYIDEYGKTQCCIDEYSGDVSKVYTNYK